MESPSERLHNLQPKRHRLCMHIPKQILKYLYRIYSCVQTYDTERNNNLTLNRCNLIWLCNRSLDGATLQLQNGGRTSDTAQSYTSSGHTSGYFEVIKCQYNSKSLDSKEKTCFGAKFAKRMWRFDPILRALITHWWSVTRIKCWRKDLFESGSVHRSTRPKQGLQEGVKA